jgi:hypothetical protein
MRQFAVGNLEHTAATKHYVDNLYRSNLDANWRRPVKYISIRRNSLKGKYTRC